MPSQFIASTFTDSGVPPAPAGGSGVLPPLSLSGTLVFGSASVNATGSVLVTALGTGSFAGGRLAFSSNQSSFKITKVDDVTLSSPFLCESGSYHFGMNGSGSLRFTFATRYTDGTSKTMPMILYRGDGVQDGSTDVSALVSDPFVGEALTNASLLGVWTVPTDAVHSGNVANDQSVLVDGAGVTANSILAQIASTGNWIFDTQDGPGTVGLLTRCVSTKTNRGGSNYGVMSGSLSGTPLSGIVIFKVVTPQTAGQFVETFSPQGVKGSPNPGSIQFLWGDTAVDIYSAGFAGTPMTHGDTTTWVTLTFRTTAATSSTVEFKLSRVGLSHGGLGTAGSGGNTYTFRNGFRFAYNPGVGDTSTGTVKWAAVALFSADIGNTKLSSLHGAII